MVLNAEPRGGARVKDHASLADVLSRVCGPDLLLADVFGATPPPKLDRTVGADA